MRYKFLIILFIIGCSRKKFNNPADPANAPAPPEIIFPKNDTLVYDNPPRFIWHKSITPYPYDEIVYEISVASDRDFNNILFSATIDDTFYYKTYELLPKQVFWRIRAKGDRDLPDECWSSWSYASFNERFPLIGKYENLPSGEKIFIKDNYAYVIASNNFYILDIHNPNQITLNLSFRDTLVDKFFYMEKEGNYLYFTGHNDFYKRFIRVYELSNYFSVRFVSSCSLYRPSQLAVAHPALYVNDDGNSIKIINISNPESIFVANAINEYVHNLAVKDNYLLIFASNQIKVYNITNRFNPTLVNTYNYNFELFSIWADTLVIWDNGDESKITLLDISNLPSITKMDTFSISGYPSRELVFSNKYIIIISPGYYPQGAYIFELIKPNPLVGKLTWYSFIQSIGVKDNYLYLLSYGSKLFIVNL